jgi:hypothetical protein
MLIRVLIISSIQAKELDFNEFPRCDGARLKNGKLLEELDIAMSKVDEQSKKGRWTDWLVE